MGVKEWDRESEERNWGEDRGMSQSALEASLQCTSVTKHRTSRPLLRIFNNSLIDLASPSNLSSWWNFGSCLGLILGIQILRGLFLAIHYTCDSSFAFASLSHIIRDVYGGWFLRSVHANGASFFFVALYAHIGRGIYYGSYMYIGVWYVGVLLLLLVMASAFLGYVLPWGQIRFWGATVITNLFRAVPYVGGSLVTWLWGGFSVDNPTLTRFFTFHFLMPFSVTALSIIHIFFLHQAGSNNPLGVSSHPDKVPFHCFYTIKDAFGFCILVSALLLFVFFFPQLLGEAENFIAANPLVTPPHIVPEWYFLFAYAILRSVPSKLGGVRALVGSILILIILTITHFQAMKGLVYYGPVKAAFWFHVVIFLLLTTGGSWPVEAPYLILSRFLSFCYFRFYALLGLYRFLWDLVLS